MRVFIAFLCLASVASAEFSFYEPLKTKPNLLELARTLNLTRFVEILEHAGLDSVINHEGKFTVFAPTNEAFAKEMHYPNEVTLAEKAKFHVAQGLIKSFDITDDKLVRTLLPKRFVRLNKYFGGEVITANGRPVIAKDYEAVNGVIHVLSDVMTSVYGVEGSVITEIEKTCPHLSTFIDLVKHAGLYSTLMNRGPFTLLVPENGAFSKLPSDMMNRLKSDVPTLRKILMTHVIPGTLYTPGLKNGDVIKTLSGYKICVVIKNGRIMFGKATVDIPDITAMNGAVHTIDELIMPDMLEHDTTELFSTYPYSYYPHTYHTSGMVPTRPNVHYPTFVTLLKRMGFTSFAEAVMKTGMDKVIETESNVAFTVIAPTNEAWEKTERFFAMSGINLIDRVKFHICQGVIKMNKIGNEMMVPTLLPERFLKFNVFETFMDSKITANGKVVDFIGMPAKNGLVHVLREDEDFDNIYTAEGTLLKEMSKIPALSEFIKLMEKTGLANILEQPVHSFTVFAPTNTAMENLAHLSTTHDVFEVATKILLNHVIPKTWYLKGITMVDSLTTMGGKTLPVTMENAFTKEVMLNGVPLIHGDMTCFNGVFFVVDRIFVE